MYTAMVACAFEHCHARGIVHRDLKPENLLFAKNGYLKLVDFGFAKMITDRSWTLCGTPDYLAPEIISNKGHNHCVDWWTLGVLLYEMVTGEPPFAAASQDVMYRKIMAGAFPRLDDKQFNKSAHCQSIMVSLLALNPSKRLGSKSVLKEGSTEVLSHPFFGGIDWAKLKAQTLKMPYVPRIRSDSDLSNFDQYESELGDAEQWDSCLTDESQAALDQVFGSIA
uniref:Protein kinase domain-containing protein n=1 Tax=Haptolina ericina TaxID=156174 RepID=A0A7S3ATK8_9EUKA